MKGWKGVIQKVGFWRAECMLSGRNLPFPDDWAGACILQPLMEVRVCLTVAETTCLEESRCIISGIFQAKKRVVVIINPRIPNIFQYCQYMAVAIW